MSFLGGLHGTLAAIVIYTLLFADETGLPLPFAPSEVLLILGGVLTRTSALSAWTFYPVAAVAMVAGMLVGYGWSRAVGLLGLQRLARRVHAEPILRRVQDRLQQANPAHIAIARLLPGVRPWATLSCGATGVPLRGFLIGATPALIVWEAAWTTLGVAIGLPAEHLLGAFEKLVLRGVILVVLGVMGYVGLQRLQRQGLVDRQRRAVWLPAALAVTGGALTCMTIGVLAIGRGLVGDDQATWIDGLLAAILIAIVGGVAIIRNRERGIATTTRT